MLFKYIDFVLNEGGSISRPEAIYWNTQFDHVKNLEWTNISTGKGMKYEIRFEAGTGEYNKYKVLVDVEGDKEEYLMEDSTQFIEKFKIEFMKNPFEYMENMKYDPKCLDIEHMRDAKKYNM